MNLFSDLGEFVKDLNSHSRHFVPVIDSGIAQRILSHNGYPPYHTYSQGINMDIFIKAGSGDDAVPFTGRSFPGDVVYPDWMHP